MGDDVPYLRPTLADVRAWVGNVPNHRIRCWPPPGASAPTDLAVLNASGGVYELVAAVAVERAAAPAGCRLRAKLVRLLGGTRVEVGKPIQLDRFAVRIPDITLTASKGMLPLFVVDITRPDNTAEEIALRLSEYSQAGVKLVWYVDPERREVDVYPEADPARKTTLGMGEELDGGAVLPGLALKVARIFESRAPKK